MQNPSTNATKVDKKMQFFTECVNHILNSFQDSSSTYFFTILFPVPICNITCPFTEIIKIESTVMSIRMKTTTHVFILIDITV